MSVVVIGLVCEDNGHFRAVTRLIDAAAVAAHDWLDETVDHVRAWRGLADDQPWYKYRPEDVGDLDAAVVGGLRIKRHGHIAGEPLRPGASMWRNVLSLFSRLQPRPEVVVLAHDLDGYAERRAGMEQVRQHVPWPFEVVLATPQPEIEAWLVAGFEPAADDERARLDALRSELSFNPTTASHRLTSHPNDASTDAKRVLAKLVDDDDERGMACLDDRERLRARGTNNGLAAFLDEVEQRIVPRFGGSGS